MSALLTIRCVMPPASPATMPLPALSGDRLLTYQAMRLLIRLDAELRYTRIDVNEDRFRRIMQARPRAVARIRRRWDRLNRQPPIPLGSLRRRYHANLMRYLYESRQE